MKPCLPRLPALAAALVLWLSAGVSAVADDDREEDHERARLAVEHGEAMPLVEILAAVGPRIDGEIVATEFDQEDGTWVYEIKFIDRSGRLIELYVDARTATILGAEED